MARAWRGHGAGVAGIVQTLFPRYSLFCLRDGKVQAGARLCGGDGGLSERLRPWAVGQPMRRCCLAQDTSQGEAAADASYRWFMAPTPAMIIC
eukprot:gene25518-biopygen12006